MIKTLEKQITAVEKDPLIRFFYGTMRSGKTKKLINDSLDYERHVVFILPEEDTSGVIKSRAFKFAGNDKHEFIITPDIIFGKHHPGQSNRLIDLICQDDHAINKVVIDEAQFLRPEDIYELAEVCRSTNIKLDVYGLLTDFHGNIFEGSREWIEQADESICIEGHCEFPGCSKNSYYNCLMKQKKSPDSNVVVGDSQYIVLCPEHRELYKKAGVIEG